MSSLAEEEACLPATRSQWCYCRSESTYMEYHPLRTYWEKTQKSREMFQLKLMPTDKGKTGSFPDKSARWPMAIII